MDIPNLSTPVENSNLNVVVNKPKLSPIIPIFGVIIFAILSGYGLNKIITLKPNDKPSENMSQVNEDIIPVESISSTNDIQVGKIYGDAKKAFKDSAIGIVEKGSVNGEGTHILNREGGISQRVSMTSSVLDLDLFVGKKVEVRGETNSSNKSGWLMDVGNVKVLE